MAKTTTELNEKRKLINELMNLNGNIGGNKVIIEDLKSQVVEHERGAGFTGDADVKNYLTSQAWAIKRSINAHLVDLEADLAKRAELQKQLAAKVVNILDRSTSNEDIKYYRWLARYRLKEKGVIDKLVLNTVLEFGQHASSEGYRTYEIQLEILVAPKMEAQIISADYDGISKAEDTLEMLKTVLGDMVILLEGYVSPNYRMRENISAETLIAVNKRLDDKIRELESMWWGDING